MDGIPESLAAFCALAFVLGARHGFDADHLAVIDGVTRLNARTRPRLSRAAGALFSLGHGASVLAVVLVAKALAIRSAIPAWLEVSGTVVSVAFLLALAMLNLLAAFNASSDVVVRPTGFRARWLRNAPIFTLPAGVLATGMLFAISFDTISLAVLFAVTGEALGGGANAVFAALCFVLGMLAVDGADGLWISRLARAADRRAAIASRIMAAAVGLISLAVCVFAFSRSVMPSVATWGDQSQLWLGAVIIGTLALASAVGFALRGGDDGMGVQPRTAPARDPADR